jgi:anaerobic selenocysteine-containing dehydrogenase
MSADSAHELEELKVAGAMDRRDFLRRGAATAGGLTIATSLQGLLSRAEAAPSGRRDCRPPTTAATAPWSTTRTECSLCPRVSPHVRFGETGQLMSDGVPTPSLHDGMAAFEGPTRNLV